MWFLADWTILKVVGFESGTIKFMKNHFEIQTIRHHTSPVKSIGVIRNNSNLDFITSCHDQINLWRLDEGITLLRFELENHMKNAIL